MRSQQTATILIATVLLGGVAGWWLTQRAVPEEEVVATPSAPTSRPVLHDPPPRASKSDAPRKSIGRDADALAEGALANQRSLVFSDRESMERFLAAAKGKGIAILGSIDRLNALHVGFLSVDDLMALLDGTEETGFIYPVSLPTPQVDSVPEGAVGIGNQLLSWLGIDGNNSAFGTGLKIAILDTGSTLAGAINHFLVPAPADASAWNGHGTAVADIIGQVVPSAQLLSWRVADDNGQSNSFLLAQGVLAAMDSGVDFINISMGSYGNSGILRQAIELAQQKGIVIYASAGNEGYDRVAFPAGYAGVISVGAVDALNNHLPFSNAGDVDLVGPGLDLVTAWTGDRSIYFTGTSASAPVALATHAAAMSDGTRKITASSAYDLISANLNDSGAPGVDPYYGGGSVDLGRVMRSSGTAYTDAAVAANYITTGSNGQPVLQVTVQNRGTSTLVNTPVQVSVGSATWDYIATTLPPGRTATYTIPLGGTPEGTRIQSSISVSGGAMDSRSSNNRRTDVFTSGTR